MPAILSGLVSGLMGAQRILAVTGDDAEFDEDQRGISGPVRGEFAFEGVSFGYDGARVLIHDPAILVLDEATASVDPFTEAQIQEGLEEVFRDRTSIIIAHRLSTVKNADRIVVLEEGQIIEEGTHDALLAQGGHYADLYNTYFRHQSLEYIEEAGRVGEWV